ncbi:tyrosine-type recombinase/integrase [Humisphaera borealis]|uniref:Tyrosine-type recombinase/integrase n=1 Tax=Humisphaera borealis TaxID=2807512 RepID=A0A7M2X3U5_9BACT|nr:tyrosine-type recombinase/integrase [Humisphaera borealis]QOV92112.1 tyrosine-type recombinase/integrase [Humisphaera borealis]
MRNWDQLLDRYMEQYAARGIAVETVANVRRELERLGCWLKNRRPRPRIEDVGSDLLQDYLQRRGSWKAKATLSGVMSTVRGFGEFLVLQGAWVSNPLRWMKGPKLRMYDRIPRRIGGKAQQDLWQEAAKVREEYHRYLWLASLSLLYGTGLRRGELHRLNLSDWSGQEGTLRVDGRKTRRERSVALPELTWRCIESYLPRRQNHLLALGIREESALLIDKDGGRLSGGAISRGIGRLVKRAGIDHVTLHQFRHSCASDLLGKGVKLPEIQRLLGHQTVSTTVRYLHVADPERHAAVARHPINQMLGLAGTAPASAAVARTEGGCQ